MRYNLRLLLLGLSVLVLLCILLIHYVSVLASIWGPYDVGSYLTTAALSTLHGKNDSTIVQWDGIVRDKVIVIAKLETEDTEWVQEYLPEWQSAIYTVNPSEATLNDPTALTVPMSKGHEAMPYLTYIIENYSALPSILVFLHAHRNGFSTAWHTDAPMHDNINAIRGLQIPFVRSNGYTNLRCNPDPGCLVQEGHVTKEVWNSFFANTSMPLVGTSPRSPNIRPRDVRLAESVYEELPEIKSACCAQFAVSRERVMERPVTDYRAFREWLLHTDKDDASSGRVFVYLWHIIFGMESVHCPGREVCKCQVYGQCQSS